jgi:hypothetical protein
MKEGINITLDRDLWDNLSEIGHRQSILQKRRFPTIKVLRIAVHVFLKMSPEEVNEILNRTRTSHGYGE